MSSSSSANNDPILIAIHPEGDEEFRRSAPPKRVIIEGRNERVVGCTNCGRSSREEGVIMKRCTKCQIVCYCSKECQKDHWSKHKLECVEGDQSDRQIRSLLKSFQLHELHRIPSQADRKKYVRKPWFAYIDVGIEPSDIVEFMNLYHFKENWDKDNMEGMLQFHHLFASWPGMSPSTGQLEVWTKTRRAADEEGQSNCAVVLLLLAAASKQASMHAIVVGEEAVDAARRAPVFSMVSALSGKKLVLQMTIESCFEYMNTHIRADRKNRLLLRMPMREADKELIRNVGRESVQTSRVKMFRMKIAREVVYQGRTMEDIEEERRQVTEAGCEAAPNVVSGEERRLEGGTAEVQDETQAPAPSGMPNRAERRRLEREAKKEQGHRRKR